MVMYEDDGVGFLILKYETTPSANEVIRDILEAPIESGETFQNTKKGRKAIKDDFILVSSDMKKKATDEVEKVVEEKTGWESCKITKAENSAYVGLWGFKLPEGAESEQKALMERI